MPELVTPSAVPTDLAASLRPTLEGHGKLDDTRGHVKLDETLTHRTTPKRSVPPATHGWYPAVKIAFDWTLSGLLLAASPFIALAALLVKLTSRGPAFYSQVRLGLNGKPFWIYKIRTMTHNC